MHDKVSACIILVLEEAKFLAFLALQSSYKMVGVKITVACYGQNNRIFGILFNQFIRKTGQKH
jgi:hypothetical protein